MIRIKNKILLLVLVLTSLFIVLIQLVLSNTISEYDIIYKRNNFSTISTKKPCKKKGIQQNSTAISKYQSENGVELNSLKLKTGSESRRISLDSSRVKFYLYPDPSNSDRGELIVLNDATSLRQSSFKSGLKLKLFIHGFRNMIEDPFVKNVVRAYHGAWRGGREVFNLILVDWSELAGDKNLLSIILYPIAADNVIAVGNQVGRFINFLRSENAIRSYDDVHLIGFSLGAHIAGVCGEFLAKQNSKIGRITGLDPAGPIFKSILVSMSNKLDERDAHFVDNIHTNSKNLGSDMIKGHVDFWPNGGYTQPDCGFDLGGICSHHRAVDYFTNSINDPNKYKGCKCDSWADFLYSCPCTDSQLFGEKTSQNARGSYYFSTN